MKYVYLLILISSLVVSPMASDTLDQGSLAEGCTTILAAGNATRDGSVILAKNRDLSEYEIQWLYRAPRQRHTSGPTVRLQYIEIPQVSETWAWVGSKSYTKKWGVGMGMNMWGVAVADNDAPTREPLEGERGLHDNDVCRLILERSKTANEGMLLAGILLEQYGHSSVGEIYWIADSKECWIVEGAGHHWAALRITNGVAVRANQFQITKHWDAGSKDLIEYAIKMGWCNSQEDFNFARCYSSGGYPYATSQTRLERGLELLEGKVGNLTREDLMKILADHYEKTTMYDTAHNNAKFRTICSKRTVSAMVAHIKPVLPSEMQLMWHCMSTPCTSVFLPLYANVSSIPNPYSTGGGPEDISSYDPNSAWWVFKKLQLLVDERYDEVQPKVRDRWDGFYRDTAARTNQLEKELLQQLQEKRIRDAGQLMDKLVEEKLTEAYRLAIECVKELSSPKAETKSVEETRVVAPDLSVVFMILVACMVTLYLLKTKKFIRFMGSGNS